MELDPTAVKLVPPNRFAAVEEGLYRSGYPVIRNFNFLRRLNLKCVVSLTPEEPTHDLRELCRSFGIISKHVGVEKHRGDPHLLSTDLNVILALLLNVELHPMLVHCLDGRHVVGMGIMALRKIQGWEAVAIEAEYGRFVGAPASLEERGFLGDYGGGVALPEAIPKWLWGGAWAQDGRPKKHPLLKIKFPQIAAKHADERTERGPHHSHLDRLPTEGSPYEPSPSGALLAEGSNAELPQFKQQHSESGVDDVVQQAPWSQGASFFLDEIAAVGSSGETSVIVNSVEARALVAKAAAGAEVRIRYAKDRAGVRGVIRSVATSSSSVGGSMTSAAVGGGGGGGGASAGGGIPAAGPTASVPVLKRTNSSDAIMSLMK